MSDTRLTLMEAIATQRTVSARYNGDVMTLAPHLLFERRGDLFLGALNMSKTWRSDDEKRLGHYKLKGLAAAELKGETFNPLPGSETIALRPEDTLVLAV